MSNALDISQATTTAVTSTSGVVAEGLLQASVYLYVADVESWITSGASPTATVNGSTMQLVPASTPIYLTGLAAKLAAISSTSGHCTVTKVNRN